MSAALPPHKGEAGALGVNPLVAGRRGGGFAFAADPRYQAPEPERSPA